MSDATDKDQSQSKAPFRTIRDGNISSSIWEKPSQTAGEFFYPSKIVRNWQDENGTWHESSSFSERDLSRLIGVAETTKDVIAARRFAHEAPARLEERAQLKQAYKDQRTEVQSSQEQPAQQIKQRPD